VQRRKIDTFISSSQHLITKRYINSNSNQGITYNQIFIYFLQKIFDHEDGTNFDLFNNLD